MYPEWARWPHVTRPEVIKHFPCSTQLSMKFILLINLKLPTISNSFLHEILSANKYENANYCWHFHINMQRKFNAPLSWVWKKFYNLVTWKYSYAIVKYGETFYGRHTAVSEDSSKRNDPRTLCHLIQKCKWRYPGKATVTKHNHPEAQKVREMRNK